MHGKEKAVKDVDDDDDIDDDDDDDDDDEEEEVELEGNFVKIRRKSVNKDGHKSERIAGKSHKWIEMGPKTLGTLKQKILNYLHQCDDALNKLEVEVSFHHLLSFSLCFHSHLFFCYILSASCIYRTFFTFHSDWCFFILYCCFIINIIICLNFDYFVLFYLFIRIYLHIVAINASFICIFYSATLLNYFIIKFSTCVFCTSTGPYGFDF